MDYRYTSADPRRSWGPYSHPYRGQNHAFGSAGRGDLRRRGSNGGHNRGRTRPPGEADSRASSIYGWGVSDAHLPLPGPAQGSAVPGVGIGIGAGVGGANQPPRGNPLPFTMPSPRVTPLGQMSIHDKAFASMRAQRVVESYSASQASGTVVPANASALPSPGQGHPGPFGSPQVPGPSSFSSEPARSHPPTPFACVKCGARGDDASASPSPSRPRSASGGNRSAPLYACCACRAYVCPLCWIDMGYRYWAVEGHPSGEFIIRCGRCCSVTGGEHLYPAAAPEGAQATTGVGPVGAGLYCQPSASASISVPGVSDSEYDPTNPQMSPSVSFSRYMRSTSAEGGSRTGGGAPMVVGVGVGVGGGGGGGGEREGGERAHGGADEKRSHPTTRTSANRRRQRDHLYGARTCDARAGCASPYGGSASRGPRTLSVSDMEMSIDRLLSESRRLSEAAAASASGPKTEARDDTRDPPSGDVGVPTSFALDTTVAARNDGAVRFDSLDRCPPAPPERPPQPPDVAQGDISGGGAGTLGDALEVVVSAEPSTPIISSAETCETSIGSVAPASPPPPSSSQSLSLPMASAIATVPLTPCASARIARVSNEGSIVTATTATTTSPSPEDAGQGKASQKHTMRSATTAPRTTKLLMDIFRKPVQVTNSPDAIHAASLPIDGKDTAVDPKSSDSSAAHADAHTKPSPPPSYLQSLPPLDTMHHHADAGRLPSVSIGGPSWIDTSSPTSAPFLASALALASAPVLAPVPASGPKDVAVDPEDAIAGVVAPAKSHSHPPAAATDLSRPSWEPAEMKPRRASLPEENGDEGNAELRGTSMDRIAEASRCAYCGKEAKVYGERPAGIGSRSGGRAGLMRCLGCKTLSCEKCSVGRMWSRNTAHRALCHICWPLTSVTAPTTAVATKPVASTIASAAAPGRPVSRGRTGREAPALGVKRNEGSTGGECGEGREVEVGVGGGGEGETRTALPDTNMSPICDVCKRVSDSRSAGHMAYRWQSSPDDVPIAACLHCVRTSLAVMVRVNERRRASGGNAAAAVSASRRTATKRRLGVESGSDEAVPDVEQDPDPTPPSPSALPRAPKRARAVAKASPVAVVAAASTPVVTSNVRSGVRAGKPKCETVAPKSGRKTKTAPTSKGGSPGATDALAQPIRFKKRKTVDSSGGPDEASAHRPGPAVKVARKDGKGSKVKVAEARETPEGSDKLPTPAPKRRRIQVGV